MSNARFNVGETVTVTPAADESHIPKGRYTVLQVMPSDAQGCSYRVRCEADGVQRAMREEQMESAPARPMHGPSWR